jgi:ribonuclease P protein component
MLKKLFRISNSQEYNNTYKNGLKIPGKYLIAYIMINNLGINRFGIVASKKVGNAVIRNRSRRRIRAIAESSGEHLQPGYDIVIIARQSIVATDYNRLEKDFYTVMKKAGLC